MMRFVKRRKVEEKEERRDYEKEAMVEEKQTWIKKGCKAFRSRVRALLCCLSLQEEEKKEVQEERREEAAQNVHSEADSKRRSSVDISISSKMESSEECNILDEEGRKPTGYQCDCHDPYIRRLSLRMSKFCISKELPCNLLQNQADTKSRPSRMDYGDCDGAPCYLPQNEADTDSCSSLDNQRLECDLESRVMGMLVTGAILLLLLGCIH